MRGEIGERVRTLLIQKDYDALLELCQRDRHYWRALRLYVYETEDRLRWPAFEAIARLIQQWWQEGRQEEVREYIRSLFWSLNDESGGIGWNAPQIIAEIIATIPELIDPYGSMLIDRTMDEPLLVKNGLWGIGRMGPLIRPAVEFFHGKVLQAFESKDAEILGIFSWAMGAVGFLPAVALIDKLCDRNDPVRIYFDGDFHQKKLGEWAREVSHTMSLNNAV